MMEQQRSPGWSSVESQQGGGLTAQVHNILAHLYIPVPLARQGRSTYMAPALSDTTSLQEAFLWKWIEFT